MLRCKELAQQTHRAELNSEYDQNGTQYEQGTNSQRLTQRPLREKNQLDQDANARQYEPDSAKDVERFERAGLHKRDSQQVQESV